MTPPFRQYLFTSESVAARETVREIGCVDADFTWERIGVAPALRAAAGLPGADADPEREQAVA